MPLQKRGVWGAAPARQVWGGGATPSQKIYNCFHFIKIRPINETLDIFWMPSASCYNWLPHNWSNLIFSDYLHRSLIEFEPGTYRIRGGHSLYYAIAVVPILKIRCRGHSKYVRSLFERFCFYKMKAVINFLRWGAPPPPYPPGLGCAPDPTFLRWHRELNGQ